MKYSKRAIFSMLLIFALCSAVSAKPVQINGKDLDLVDDIMAEAGVEYEFPKKSLFIFRKNTDGGYNGQVMSFNNDGSILATYNPVAQPNPGSKMTDWNGGIYPVVTSGDANLNRRILIPTAMRSSSGTKFHVTGFSYAASVALNPNEFKNLTAGLSSSGSEYNNAVVTDAKGGLFPAGTDKEFIVAGIVRNVRGGDAESAIVAFADGENPTDLTRIYQQHRDNEGSFITTRFAVGDFDNDGRRDEIAIRALQKVDEDTEFHFDIIFYKVSYSGNKLQLTELHKYITRATTHCRIEASAFVTGDFDGDGKEEAALIEGDLSDNHRGNDRSYPSVQIFKKSGNTWTDDYATTWSNSSYQMSDPGKGKEYRVWGLQATAGDLDGDGKDEIIVFAVHGDDGNSGTPFVSVWTCESGIKPKVLGYKDLTDAKFGLKDMYYDDNGDPMYWSQRTLSIVAAPFTGNINGIFSLCEVAISVAGTKNHGDDSKQRVWLLKPVLKNGKFSEFANPVKIFEDSNNGTVGLTAFDFAGETLKLGEPEHIKVEGHKNYSVILKTPPYHIDYVKVPWNPEAPAAINNFGYLGRAVQYKTNGTNSSETLATSKTQHAAEAGLKFKIGGSVSGSFGKIMTMGIASARVKAGGSFGLGLSGGFTKVTENSDKNATSHSLSTSLKTETTDVLNYTAANYHIWRYPIIPPAPVWIFDSLEEDNGSLEDETTELTNDLFITYTLCDEASDHACDSKSSSQYDDYNPSYEEGNLFSYPNSVVYGYPKEEVQAQLTDESSFTLTVNEQKDLTLNESGSSSEKVTTSWKAAVTPDLQFDVNVGMNIGPMKQGTVLPSASADVSFSANLYGKYAYEATDGTTSTKSWSNSEQVTISAPTSSLAVNKQDVNYITSSRVYVDASGALTTPFAVNFDESAWMWNYNRFETVQSPYVVSPDPALVLPMRYSLESTRSQEGVTYTYWKFADNEANATKIRGVKFYDTATKQYVPGALEQGFTYEITVPIYNASFVDVPGGVVVEYGYKKFNTTESVQLGRQTIELRGWKNNTDSANGGTNKANLVFKWTPDIEEGDYDLYVILDPDNLIDEVHEAWTKETRDGNNNGYRPFSIVNTLNNDVSASFVRTAEADEVTSKDFELRFVDVNNESHGEMTASELRTYVLRQENDVEVRGYANYKGSEVLKNVNVEILCTTLDDTNHKRVVASKRILALRPGRSRDFYFTAEPDKIRERKFDIRLTCSKGSFTYEGGSGKVDDESSQGDEDDNNNGSKLIKHGSSSGGGCEVGLSSLAILTLLGAVLGKKK